MNADKLQKAGIDYNRGVKRFMGRAHLYEKALSKFPKDGAFARIRAAHEANDVEQLLASAHEFKGMCGNIALPALYDASDALVTLLRGGAFSPADLDAAYMHLEKEYRAANEAILAAMEEA